MNANLIMTTTANNTRIFKIRTEVYTFSSSSIKNFYSTYGYYREAYSPEGEVSKHPTIEGAWYASQDDLAKGLFEAFEQKCAGTFEIDEDGDIVTNNQETKEHLELLLSLYLDNDGDIVEGGEQVYIINAENTIEETTIEEAGADVYQEGYTYWDGHNHKTTTLTSDFEHCEYEEVTDEYAPFEDWEEIHTGTYNHGNRTNYFLVKKSDDTYIFMSQHDTLFQGSLDHFQECELDELIEAEIDVEPYIARIFETTEEIAQKMIAQFEFCEDKSNRTLFNLCLIFELGLDVNIEENLLRILHSNKTLFKQLYEGFNIEKNYTMIFEQDEKGTGWLINSHIEDYDTFLYFMKKLNIPYKETIDGYYVENHLVKNLVERVEEAYQKELVLA